MIDSSIKTAHIADSVQDVVTFISTWTEDSKYRNADLYICQDAFDRYWVAERYFDGVETNWSYKIRLGHADLAQALVDAAILTDWMGRLSPSAEMINYETRYDVEDYEIKPVYGYVFYDRFQYGSSFRNSVPLDTLYRTRGEAAEALIRDIDSEISDLESEIEALIKTRKQLSDSFRSESA